MKRKLIILGVILLVIVNISALVTIVYQRWSFKRNLSTMGCPERPVYFLRKRVGLNDEQIKQFESFIQSFKKETKDVIDSLRQKDMRLMVEVRANDPDPEKINELIEEMGELQITFKKKAFSYLLKKKSLLTPEQQRRFMVFINKRHRHGMIGFKREFKDPR